MKKGYSRFVLMSFVLAVVFRTLLSFLSPNIVFVILFYLSFVAGIVLLGLETFKQKEFANAFNLENRFHLGFFGALAGVGAFADFLSTVFEIYNLASKGDGNILAAGIPLGFECLFAFVSVLCFAMVSMSFSKSKRYDFRQLKFLNLAPLIWLTSKGIATLSTIVDISKIDNALAYISIAFGMLAFYYFARETENDKGASAICVFCFRAFTFVAIMMFVSRLELVLSGSASPVDRDTIFALTISFVGLFVYFLEKNIFAYTKLD